MSTSKSRIEFMFGKKDTKYGVYNSLKKEFQFGICEDSPMLAQARLYYFIGDDAKKWRFQFKPIPEAIYKSTDFVRERKRTHDEPRRF